jgi:predicted alpha/beta hydrolase
MTANQASERRPSEFRQLEAVPVTTTDGANFVVRVLPQGDPAAPVVLILPAMILKAKFYLPLAKMLYSAGLSVATVDLRAQGESTPALREAPKFGYHELVEVDLPAILDAVSKRFPDAPLHLFGHSLGGQVALLSTATSTDRVKVASVTVLGTGTAYWRTFGEDYGPGGAFQALWKIQWIGLVAAVRGWWPGGVLIPGPMAGRVMTDWARHSRTGRYHPRGSGRGYDRALGEMALPVLAISLEQDILSPKSNVDFLGRRMPAASVTRWHVEGESAVVHRDHFEWIRDSAVIGQAIADWIRTGRPPQS